MATIQWVPHTVVSSHMVGIGEAILYHQIMQRGVEKHFRRHLYFAHLVLLCVWFLSFFWGVGIIFITILLQSMLDTVPTEYRTCERGQCYNYRVVLDAVP